MAIAGRIMHASLFADSDNAAKAGGGTAASTTSMEPELRRVTALRTHKRVPTIDAEFGSSDTRGGAQCSWSSTWNETTGAAHG